MPKFSQTENGYAPEQVDAYIKNLSKKYEEKLATQKDHIFSLQQNLELTTTQLKSNVEKEQQVSQALMYAVEKADEIELGAKRLYDLEIKRMRLLYKHWNNLLTELNYHPEMRQNETINDLIETLQVTVSDVLEQNKRMDAIALKTASVKQKLKTKSSENIKNILNKMDYAQNNQMSMNLEGFVREPKPEVPVKQHEFKAVRVSEIMPEHNKKQNRRARVFQSLNKLKEERTNDGSYLHTDFEKQFEGSVYAKTITKKLGLNKKESPLEYSYPTPNESGFDLKEALNPKEELDEIMKDFDFFEGGDK